MKRLLPFAVMLALWLIPLAWAQVYDPTTGYQIVIPTSSGGGGGSVIITPSSAAAAGIAPVVSASLEASHVIDAAPGNLYSISATNLTGGVSGNLLVFDATSAPGDGAVTPKVCVPFDSLGKAQASFLPGPPLVFATGITAVASSAVSCFTKTTGVITAFFLGMPK
jgi:hypothetical protein